MDFQEERWVALVLPSIRSLHFLGKTVEAFLKFAFLKESTGVRFIKRDSDDGIM